MERNCPQPGGVSGRMNRRQLLQGLGLAASAALVGSILPRAALAVGQSGGAESRVFPVTAINHLSYAATDWAKTRDFYVDLFGMRVVWDDGKGCALEFGSEAAPNGIYIRNVSKPGDKPTINHIAYGLTDFMAHKDALKAELERRGLKNIRADGEVGWICDDPVGYVLNIVVVKDKAMYPGAARPCAVAASAACEEGWEAGLKNLDKAPKPSGKGFTATAYSHVVLNVSDIDKEREFYRDMFGMKVIYDQPADPAKKQPAQCFLRFGENTLYLRPAGADGKASCNHFAFIVENYNQDAVEAELKRRGLNPKPDSKLAWTITDPDGMRIEVAGKGLPEHIAKDCNGNNASCPGGPRG